MRDSRAAPPRTDWRHNDPYAGLSGLVEEVRAPARQSVPDIQPRGRTPGHRTDGLAEAEADAFARGDDLEKEAKRSEHKRSEATKGFIHGCAIWTGRSVTALMVALLCIWAWHLGCPPSLEFLPPEKMANLEALVKLAFSSAAGALFMKYYGKHI